MFAIYSNDFNNLFQNEINILYADDACLVYVGDDLETLIKHVNDRDTTLLLKALSSTEHWSNTVENIILCFYNSLVFL